MLYMFTFVYLNKNILYPVSQVQVPVGVQVQVLDRHTLPMD